MLTIENNCIGRRGRPERQKEMQRAMYEKSKETVY